MKSILAVFQSRRDAIRFGTMMRRRGVAAIVTSTPSTVGTTCGLSVRFPSGAMMVARGLLSQSEYMSFQGFYEI